ASRQGGLRDSSRGAPRLGFCLSAASCLWRGCASLRRYRFGLFLQLFDDPPRPRRVDVDAGAHRARQRDRANVAALRGAWLGAEDLLEQRRVVLGDQSLDEALLADVAVDVLSAVVAVSELARLRSEH